LPLTGEVRGGTATLAFENERDGPARGCPPTEAREFDRHGTGCGRESGLVQGDAHRPSQDVPGGAQAAAEDYQFRAGQINEGSDRGPDHHAGLMENAPARNIARACSADEARQVVDLQAIPAGAVKQRWAAGVAFQAPTIAARTPPALMVERDVTYLGRSSAATALEAAAQHDAATNTRAQLDVGQIPLALPPAEEVFTESA
jgi:hypothetical protein